MKNFSRLLSAILSVLVISQSSAIAARPQTAEEIANIDRRQSISVYPLYPFAGQLTVAYSFQIGDRIALTPRITGGFIAQGLLDRQSTAFQIGPALSARFFMTNSAFNTGWYLEPMAGFSYTRLGNGIDGWSFIGSGVFGYAWYWDGGFTLNVGGGIAYRRGTKAVQGADGFLSWPLPIVDFAVGYSW